jgi:hypothetical protein
MDVFEYFILTIIQNHITCFHNIWAIYLCKKKIIFNIKLIWPKNMKNKTMIMPFVTLISMIAHTQVHTQ